MYLESNKTASFLKRKKKNLYSEILPSLANVFLGIFLEETQHWIRPDISVACLQHEETAASAAFLPDSKENGLPCPPPSTWQEQAAGENRSVRAGPGELAPKSLVNKKSKFKPKAEKVENPNIN